MNGKIVATNPYLGVLVVDRGEQGCVVLDVQGQSGSTVGDEVSADWNTPGTFIVRNLTQGHDLEARVQRLSVPRNEAVGSVAVF